MYYTLLFSYVFCFCKIFMYVRTHVCMYIYVSRFYLCVSAYLVICHYTAEPAFKQLRNNNNNYYYYYYLKSPCTCTISV
jgi:hypothetical protein